MTDWLVELKAPTFSDYFTLDDATKGVLDNTSYPLGINEYVNITSRVRRITTNRGRSKLLDKFTAGNCSIVLDNRDRYFDPTNVDSPLYGEIVPRNDIRISYLGEYAFTGSVSDWNFDYTFSDATAEIVGHDSFTKLATTIVPAGTLTSETINERINNVLDLVDWDADLRDIDDDLLVLGSEVIGDKVNTLSYLQKIELSSNGLFFIDKDGLIKYIFRYQGDAVDVTVGVDDGIPTNAFNVTYGSEELTNSVTVNYFLDGEAASVTLESVPSQTSYGVLERSYDTLLSSEVDAENFGQLILARYKEPTYRIDEIGFNIKGLTPEQTTDLMGLELGNKIKLKWKPLGVGEVFYRFVLVDSIEHVVTPGTHDMKMKVTDLGTAIETVAVGGSYTTDFIDEGDLYRMHVYDTVGTFDFTIDGDLDVEVLIIGGGGSAGNGEAYIGGGGGGGIAAGDLSLTGAQTVTVVVGVAGERVFPTPYVPVNGGDSSFGTYVAPGGGAGGEPDSDGSDGGNGGGASGAFATSGTVQYYGGSSVAASVSPLTFYGNDGTDNVITGTKKGGDGGSAGYTSTFTGIERTYGVGGAGIRVPSFVIPETPEPVLDSYGQGEGDTGTFYKRPVQGAVFVRYKV
jgi:hypothetical protein